MFPNGAIVVTGGGAGIGRAIAMACANLGGRIAVLDRDRDAARDAADQALAAGAPMSVGLTCDVRDEAQVDEAIRTAADALGPIRGLVTSAGVDRGRLVHESSLCAWEEVIDTNLTGVFLSCKHALLQMIEHRLGGSIVCLSSPWGQVTAPGGASAYSASKGGVSALVRSLALDYARFDIRVNALVPGATETALMWSGLEPEAVPAARARISDQLALGRLGRPEEIAQGAVWLLSEQSSYATGSHLVIDGGLLARGSIEG